MMHCLRGRLWKQLCVLEWTKCVCSSRCICSPVCFCVFKGVKSCMCVHPGGSVPLFKNNDLIDGKRRLQQREKKRASKASFPSSFYYYYLCELLAKVVASATSPGTFPQFLVCEWFLLNGWGFLGLWLDDISAKSHYCQLAYSVIREGCVGYWQNSPHNRIYYS